MVESYKGTEFDDFPKPRPGTRGYYYENPAEHPNFRENRTRDAARRRQAGIHEERTRRNAIISAKAKQLKKDKLAISTVLSRIFGNKK
jgi:hypothetical protein